MSGGGVELILFFFSSLSSLLSPSNIHTSILQQPLTRVDQGPTPDYRLRTKLVVPFLSRI